MSGDQPRRAAAGRAVRRAAATTLALEALTVLFAIAPVATLGGGLTPARLGVLVGLATALLVAAGLLRLRFGYAVGTGLQALVVAAGLLTPALYLLGALFAAVWAYVLHLRSRLT